MGRPRMIIVIRHAQSEGNQNRQIHQTVPDHRVKLTEEGWKQAREAGYRLRALLKPSDTLRIYTSPYRRTRETTDGILQTFTSDDPDPSPFPRNKIKVFEEPRLREQDFGNFQPDSAAMEKMWKERAEYGHFFYRIANGESAADAYDRISGFNETLFRSFEDEEFPSVCVLVTHGLMTRVFLMRWYHWSVEYFEDLRNVNHCEMVIMKRSPGSRKFCLQNQLRTWSELRRAAAEKAGTSDGKSLKNATPPTRRWGHDGDSHVSFPKATAEPRRGTKVAEQCDPVEDEEEAFPHVPQATMSITLPFRTSRTSHVPSYIEGGRDFGGSFSGVGTPQSEESKSFDVDGVNDRLKSQHRSHDSDEIENSEDERHSKRDNNATPTEEEKKRWMEESGLGSGARADALGDQSEDEIGHDNRKATRAYFEEERDGMIDAETKDRSLRGSVY